MISRNHQGHPRQDKDQRSCFPGTEDAGTEAHISPYAVGNRQSGPSRRPRQEARDRSAVQNNTDYNRKLPFYSVLGSASVSWPCSFVVISFTQELLVSCRCGSSPSSSSWLSPSPSSAPSPWPAVAAEVTMGVMEEEVMVAEASAEASEAVEDWEVEEALAAVSEDKT
ncbi:uncharacterized protein [Penaeus vannamei]|uniref:uncharacterized protein n=1 Tax=Penaeus vannamei TaxID=6689 RepID=UPI00387F3B1A